MVAFIKKKCQQFVSKSTAPLIQERRQRTRRACRFALRAQTDFIRAAARFHRMFERDAHAVWIVRHGDGGVHQPGVRAGFIASAAWLGAPRPASTTTGTVACSMM